MCSKSLFFFTDHSQDDWPLLPMMWQSLFQLWQLSQCNLVTESECLWTKLKFRYKLYWRIALPQRRLKCFLVYIGQYFNHVNMCPLLLVPIYPFQMTLEILVKGRLRFYCWKRCLVVLGCFFFFNSLYSFRVTQHSEKGC